MKRSIAGRCTDKSLEIRVIQCGQLLRLPALGWFNAGSRLSCKCCGWLYTICDWFLMEAFACVIYVLEDEVAVVFIYILNGILFYIYGTSYINKH